MAQDEDDAPQRKLSRQDEALVFALRENIAHYRQRLAGDLDDDARGFIARCLAEEEAMLARITGPPGT